MGIHPSSHISPNATIGSNVKIGPFCYVDDDVVIEDECTLYSHATILAGTRLGHHSTIFPNAVLGAIPQDLKFGGEYSTLEIGHHTTIRECCTLNRGTKYSGKTVIGHHCLLMAYVHVAHDCILGDHVILSNSVNLAGHVEIGDHAILGGVVAVHQFSKIGKHSMIGGTVKVRKDVPPYIKADREPIRYVGINSIGLKRRGFPIDKIDQISDIYRFLFVKHTNLSAAISKIHDQFESTEELKEIVSFINESSRGIVKGYSSDTK